MKADTVEYHEVSRGAYLLVRAGIPVGTVQPPLILDPIYPVEEIEGGVRLKLARPRADATTGKDYPDDCGVSLVPVPPDDADLTEVRAAALAEIVRVQATRSVYAVVDGVAYGIHPEARALWTAILHRIDCAERGVRPMSWPAPFITYDGTLVALSSPEAARSLYAALFDAGLAVQVAAVAAQIAVAQATTASGVVDALRLYLEGP